MGLSGEWFFERVVRFGFESTAQNALLIAFITLIVGAIIGFILTKRKQTEYSSSDSHE